MKKLVSLALVIICILTLCACGNKSSNDVSRGKTSDNVYKNESINLTFTKNDDMLFATDEEIAAMMNVSKDILENGDKIFEVSKLTTVTDFLAKDPVTGNNVVLVFEDLVKTGNSGITISQYIEASKNQLKGQSGFNYTFGDESEIKLGEETYTKLTAKLNYSGTKMNQSFYFRKVGKYMVCITVTVTDNTPISEFEAMFS